MSLVASSGFAGDWKSYVPFFGKSEPEVPVVAEITREPAKDAVEEFDRLGIRVTALAWWSEKASRMSGQKAEAEAEAEAEELTAKQRELVELIWQDSKSRTALQSLRKSLLPEVGMILRIDQESISTVRDPWYSAGKIEIHLWSLDRFNELSRTHAFGIINRVIAVAKTLQRQQLSQTLVELQNAESLFDGRVDRKHFDSFLISLGKLAPLMKAQLRANSTSVGSVIVDFETSKAVLEVGGQDLTVSDEEFSKIDQSLSMAEFVEKANPELKMNSTFTWGSSYPCYFYYYPQYRPLPYTWYWGW